MGRTGWIYKVGPTFSGQTCEANERELLYERERESALAVAWRGRWDKKVDVCVSVGGRRRWGALVSCR